MEDSLITIYQTHVEITNVSNHEAKGIAEKLSVYDELTYSWDPIAVYAQNGIIYLPRACNINRIANTLNTKNIITVPHNEYIRWMDSYTFTGEPRDRIQKEAVDFLMSRDRFAGSDKYSQKALNLDTDGGKTFTVVYNIIHRRMTSAIIVNKVKLKQQWKDEFLKFSNIPESKLRIVSSIKDAMKLLDIEQDKLTHEVYFFMHQTLNNIGKAYGWETVLKLFRHLGIGIKVFDEAHQYFRNMMMIDFFTNTKYTIYLTATFKRSNFREQMVFREAFSSIYKFGEETLKYEDKIKHIKYTAVIFSSDPSRIDINTMRGARGFSNYKYCDYIMDIDPDRRCLYTMLDILEKLDEYGGKILIITATIKSCEDLKNFIRREYGMRGGIGIINSKSEEPPEDIISANRIIISTIKSNGVGTNIKGLRAIINLEPIGSAVDISQLLGRLRRLEDGSETYFYDLVDANVPKCMEFYKRRLPTIQEKVKSVDKLIV